MAGCLVFLGTIVRNKHGIEEFPGKSWNLPHYLEGIEKLDYPKELITLSFLPNDCEDDSLDLLLEFRNRNKDKYRSIIINEVNFGAPIYNRQNNKLTYDHFAKLRNIWLESLRDEAYVFSVDSDVTIPPHSLKRLLSHDVDMVSGVIPNDYGRFLMCNILNNVQVVPEVFNATEKQVPLIVARHISPIPEDELIEVDVTGAVCLMKRVIFDAGLRFSYHPQGEDVAFCQDVKKAGFKIYCDTGLRPFHVMKPEQLAELYEWKKVNLP
jgi:hypothetical protein